MAVVVAGIPAKASRAAAEQAVATVAAASAEAAEKGCDCGVGAAVVVAVQAW